jgi:hypothetical protein
MHFAKNKTASIAITILLTVTIAASLIMTPAVQAHTPPYKIATEAYVFPTVNPVGVGQTFYIYMWINALKPGTALTNTIRQHNFNLTIVDSEGTVVQQQLYPTVNDPTANQIYAWTPDTAGTYTILFNFGGDTYTAADAAQPGADPTYENDTYLPSSASATVVVQETPISTLPLTPLPTEYWTRPIYGENTLWFTIASNWLGTGAADYGGLSVSYNAGGNGNKWGPSDNVGPLTSHIMWTKPLQNGGVVGNNAFQIPGNQYFEGSAYNQRYGNPIIVNGKLYYTEPVSFYSENSLTGGPGLVTHGPEKCVDLQTGELIWSRSDVPPLSFALIWDHEDPNQHGVYPAILCTTNFAQCFDADTGDPIFNVTGVPLDAGGFARDAGPSGEQLRYTLFNNGTSTSPSYYLCLWNSTKLWNFASGMGLIPFIAGTVAGNVGSRYEYLDPTTQNVSIPVLNTMSSFTIVQAYYNDIMLCYNGTLPSSGANRFTGTYGYQPYTYFAINLNASKGAIGRILYMKTYQPAPDNVTVLEAGVDPVNRVFVENWMEKLEFVGYDLDTGDKIWGPTVPQAPLDYYGSPSSGTISNGFAYGRMYSSAYAGILYCYDTNTGDVLFTYGNGGPGNTTNSGFEVPGPYPTFIVAIGSDVVYLVTSEHTVETPIYKGALARAVNATTGEEIWTLSDTTQEFFTNSYAIADGYATWFNGYDNQIYVVGKGPSKTTVTASPKVSTYGTHVLIEGTVTDMATGTQQTEQAGKFPNGVACVSDANMADYMGYVYQQQPFPVNCSGVPVAINVWDSNNNYRNIGTAISDANGYFSFEWNPDIPGKFTVIANFEGTNGYWPSYAESSFTLTEASPTPTPTPPPTSNTDTYVTAFGIGIIVILIIIGVAIILMLRRK